MFYEEDGPFQVVDYEVEACSDQVGGDVIEAASKVRFTISKASVNPSKDGSLLRLKLQSKIGPLGVDGNGKYKGKVLFAELLFHVDKTDERYQSEWWSKQARFPFKTFLTAMGLDPAAPPRVNDEFLGSLQGQEFVADVKKKEITVKVDGKYVGTGDFKNELSNFKKAV